MDRKGAILWIIVAFGFLSAVLFYNTLDITGSRSAFIGKVQLNAIEKMGEGEKILFFIDKGAEYAVHEAAYDLGKNHGGIGCQWGEYVIWRFEGACNPVDNIEYKFKEYFNIHLNAYLSVLYEVYSVDTRYDISDIELKDGKIIGRAKKNIVLEGEGIIYNIKPYFSTDMDYDLGIYEAALKEIEESADCLVTEEKNLNNCIPGWKIEKGNKVIVFEIESEEKYPIFEYELQLKPIVINFAMDIGDIEAKASETEGLT